MTLPDKWVRLAITTALEDLEVDGLEIPTYDLRATNYAGDAYVIISTQTNGTDRSKCGFSWLSTCELQVVTRNPKNTGSRLLADDIAQEVIDLLDDLSLSDDTTLKILDQDLEFPADLTTETESEIVVQKIIRYTFRIN